MTKIIATSDLHGVLPEIPQCDILIIAGDVCPDFASSRGDIGSLVSMARQGKWLREDFKTWLDEVPAKHIVGIGGNHDFALEKYATYVRERTRWHYLLDEQVELEGVYMWGTPHVPNLSRWAFYGGENALYQRALSIPQGLDILISHGPPYGYRDKVIGGPRVGDTWLADRLSRKSAGNFMIEPIALVCGHIHEGFGNERIADSSTRVYNVSHNNENYEPVNPVVELKEFA